MIGPIRKHVFGGEPPPPKKARKKTETTIQRALVAWLRDRGIPVVRVEEARKLSIGAAVQAKLLGGESGFPDLLLYCHRIAVELKAPNGKLKPHQAEIHERMRQAGWDVLVPFGLDEAKRMIAAALEPPF